MKIKETLINLRKFGIENDVPNITDENAKFLQSLISQNNFSNVLEIGTANGYSTICLASELQKNSGRITSIEFSILSHNQAIANIKEAGLEEICTLIHGQALDIIPTLPDNSFDFVFIDGMKRRSKDFLELSRPKIKKNGIIIIDDVIKFKHKMLSLYEYVEENKINHEIIQIDSDDGVMKIIKV
ncbi:class I SAM-dependent methyltransferase [Candidatus Gracilibacteria bacterium]|nr:class I SAM-dependent methyltransferase [Candidatus Gracilibacteria bacterium]